MIALIITIAVLCLGGAIWKTNKIHKNWGKSASETISKVVEKVSPTDPAKKLKEQINQYKTKLAELDYNTQTLRKEEGRLKNRKTTADTVAKVAKEKGNRADAMEAFNMSKAISASIESVQADINANEELYTKMKDSLLGRQMQLSKFEAQQKRNELRSSANSIRRDIAKDEMLEEGLFSTDLDDDTCQEEIEAIAIERVNKDLKGGDVLDRYSEVETVDEEFEAFFNDKSEDQDNG